jgi:hypothetical protein
MGDFYTVNKEALEEDLRWARAQVFERNYRDQAVIDRLHSISQRALRIADAQHTGKYDTWQALQVSASRLAHALETYRDNHPAEAQFPFVKERGDFGVLADKAIEELTADQQAG